MTEDGKSIGVQATETTARGMGEASLKTTQLQQEAADDYWESVLDSIGDGFWVFDRSWCCTYINNRQASLVGMPKETITGKKVWKLFPDLVDTEFYKQLHQAVAEQTPIHFEFFSPTWQGWFEIRAYPSAKGVSILMLAITERKQTQELLRETEQRFQAFMNHSPASAWIADKEGQILYLNPTYFRMFQFQKQDAVGKNILDIYPAEFAQQFLENNQRVFDTQQVIETIETAPQLDGDVGEFLVYKFPIKSGSGETLLGGIAVDITERRRVEEALRASEQQLKIALQTAKLGSWQVDLTTNTLTCSEQCKANFGLPPEAEFSHQTLFAALHPEDCDRVQAAIQRSLEERTDYEIEERCFWPDGSLHWLIARGRLIDDANGIPIRMVGVTLDITERKQAEEELRLSEERFRLATRAVAGVVYDWDVQTGTVYRSEGLYQLIGVHPEDVPETRSWWIERIHPDDLAGIQSVMNVILAGNVECYDYEYRVRHQDGRWIDVWDRGYLIRDGNGQLIRVVGSSTDISERKQAEEARRRQEEELRLITDSVPALIAYVDAECRYRFVNRAFIRWFGQPALQIIGQTVEAFVGETNYQPMRHDIETVLAGHPVTSELWMPFRDGGKRYVRRQYIPDTGDSGEVKGFYALVNDITDLKQAEREREQLLARERTAREEAEAANRIKDEFLAVLSHELRSPLNPILGWTKLLRTRKFDEQATNRALETIERNATLQTQLIEDLLDVSRILQGKMALNVSPVNLATTIEAALETVRLAAEAKGIQIQTYLTPNVGFVSGDAARLQQVVWNLLSNAVKFTPRGGQVQVRLEKVEEPLKDNSLKVEPSKDKLQPSTQYAQILVSDTGKGIKPEFLPYVFEYFRQADSSTTRTFGGLGIGLAIVRHLVELHGGLVCAESPGEGLGATFRIRLPLMETFDEEPDDVPFDQAADLSGLQILVVDDEADIRELVTFILEEFGAKVTVTASAQEALAALHQAVPDVLLSDIGMPDVDGYMLMRQIRALPPEQGGQVKAIALTAYAGEYNQQQALEAGFQLHLPKPVEPEELVRAIARMVGRA